MKRKGFTLIELLAVIVILAIIALIATPIILGVIDTAKKGAAKASVQGYIKSIENQLVMNMLDNSKNGISDGTYEISELINNGIEIKNEDNISGKIIILNGKVNGCEILIDGYNAICTENGAVEISGKEKLKGTKISVIAKKLLDESDYGKYTYMGGDYLKGEQESNYVWYNGFLWRIMGINENGTVRLITEENVTAIAYGDSYHSNQTEPEYLTDEEYINDWLNKYFINNLDSGKKDIIVDGKWCINATDSKNVMRETCDGGRTFNAKVGLITLDEYNLSETSSTNTNYYLYNSQIYWLLTPDNDSEERISSSYVYYDGNVDFTLTNDTLGIRPVINVKADAIITSGDGSMNNAFVLNQKLEEKTGKLNDNSSSGEYVSLNEKIFRIVTKDGNGTKLIYDGTYNENNDFISSEFGSNNTFTTSSDIGQKLNNEVLTWIGNTDKIVESNWYQANMGTENDLKYTTILNYTDNPVKAKVGLIRIGEMLSAQSASVLTNNYTRRSSNIDAWIYWMMNSYETDKAFRMSGAGFAFPYDMTDPVDLRPVIVVSNNTMITSGNGTLQSPYIIN